MGQPIRGHIGFCIHLQSNKSWLLGTP